MNIFITGTSGFVGRNLSNYMSEKNDSFTIHNVSRDHLSLSVSELAEMLTTENAYAIVHLAGMAHDLKGTIKNNRYYEVNTEITKKIYQAFLLSNARYFIFMSSVKAAADSVNSILTEDVRPDPQTHYGKSKLLAEQFILNSELPENKYFFILRPCMIHGPGNKGNLNLLYKLSQKGIHWPLGKFENKRSFLSIDNLCFVIEELLKSNHIQSGIFQVADDESLSTNDLIRCINQIMGKKDKILYVPKWLIKSLARIGDIFRLPLNSERLKKLTESYVVSNAKLVSTLKKPLPVKSKEGLSKTFRSFEHD